MTTEICSPLGFARSSAEGTAELSWRAGRWALPGRALAWPLSAEEVATLRPWRALRVRWPAAAAPEALPPIIDLAAAGVPLTGDATPDWVHAAEPVLAGLIAGWTPGAGDGPPGPPGSPADLRREEHSVRLRRHALRRKGVGLRTPSVTVVMATRRPHLLPGALAQIARQRGVDIEVVLALHGFPRSRVSAALESFPLPLTVLETDEEAPLGVVLNQAAARARGRAVAKWDDDDWYGPEHLADLLLAKAYSGADVVGTAQEFFYLEPLKATIRRTDYTSEVWADHVAGGTILLDRAVFTQVGGFGPYSRGEDAHLLHAVCDGGGRVYRTHGLGYVLRRSLQGDHTWRLPLGHFLKVAAYQWRGFRPSLILEGP